MAGNYKEINGDLLAMINDFDIIAHGCNCLQVMGAGIAGQVARQFTHAYQKDKEDVRTALQRFGDLSYVHDDKSETVIVNLYTQYLPGAEFNIIALESALLKLILIFSHSCKIGLPMIGCGIGGANEEEVIEVIKRVLKDYDVTLVRYSPSAIK